MAKVTDASIGELIDSTLNLAFDYVRGTRSCPGLEDRDFVRMGVCRALSNHDSGRDWLQFMHETSDDATARSTLSDAMRSPRRLQMLREAQDGLFTVAGRQMAAAGVDWLEQFPELNGIEVLAADGHLIEHASHATKDAKGRNVPVGTVYGLDLRTGLSRAVTHVCGDGRRRHELPSFRRQLQASDKDVPTIWVLDRAYHDKGFWSRIRLDKGVVMITRMKENMRPVRYAPLPFDREDPVNAGVTGHHAISLEGAWGSMFEVTYCDPETGQEYAFLTTIDFPRPGLVAWLYFLRWRIEKLYDTFKNRFSEKKAWATGEEGAEAQACLIAMAYNLLRLLEAQLGVECGLSDTKVARKYDKELDQRRQKAQKDGRDIHPLLSWPRMPQLSAQFIRTVRNHLFSRKTIGALLAAFTATLAAYL